jgi:hypothetical protein
MGGGAGPNGAREPWVVRGRNCNFRFGSIAVDVGAMPDDERRDAFYEKLALDVLGINKPKAIREEAA